MLTEQDIELMEQEYLRKQTTQDIKNHICMECPECGHILNSSIDHCQNCGREINWND